MWSDGERWGPNGVDGRGAGSWSLRAGLSVAAGRGDRGRQVDATAIATLPFDTFKRTANDGRELDRGGSLATLIRQAVAACRDGHLA
jgi:hypothetical protein